ncbi:hypothetical protein D3C75_273160 [compost metagenome]
MAEQVSFLDVRNAVTAALDMAFPAVPIHGEEIKQNLVASCFFVRLLEPAHTRELGRRARRDHPLVIHYFPPDAAPNEDMYAIADQLTAVLAELMVAGQPVIGKGMHFEVVDGVLLFFVTYSFLVFASIPDDPDMRTLDHTGGLKHG